MSEKIWYAAVGKKKGGPYSTKKVIAKVLNGKLAKALVWKEGMDEWVPIFDIPEFKKARRKWKKQQAAVNEADPPPSPPSPPSPPASSAEVPKKKSRAGKAKVVKKRSRISVAAGASPPSTPPAPVAPSMGAAPSASGGKPASKGLIYFGIAGLLMLSCVYCGVGGMAVAQLSPKNESNSGFDFDEDDQDGTSYPEASSSTSAPWTYDDFMTAYENAPYENFEDVYDGMAGTEGEVVVFDAVFERYGPTYLTFQGTDEEGEDVTVDVKAEDFTREHFGTALEHLEGKDVQISVLVSSPGPSFEGTLMSILDNSEEDADLIPVFSNAQK